MENHRIVRNYELFENELLLKVYCDDHELLDICVNIDDLQFSTSCWDCTLDVLAQESTILVKLCSILKSGDC